jgi:hypothetical protein
LPHRATPRLDLHKALYKPGGAKNPFLVAGNPPLTRSMIDLETATVELLLGIRLTDEQRRKYQRLFAQDWTGWDQNESRHQVKTLEMWWSTLPTFSN